MASSARNASAILGAAFLMATSAIGPGFLNNTAVFTQRLGASFGFVILVSVLLDVAAQLNIWRIVAVGEAQAQDLANRVLPGLGYLLSALVVAGGLAFNIGNVAGAGLGIQMLTGLDIRVGAVLSVGIAIAIFTLKDFGRALDIFTRVLGVVMLVLVFYVFVKAKPPLGEALYRSAWPETVDFKAIVTLVGGTVGGYISFAGGHRLLEAGIKGTAMLPQVNRSAVQGILVTSAVRIFLFLAVLGVLATGFRAGDGNPAAAVFQAAAGRVGYAVFGVVLWCAAITSVVGAAYTSVSFVRSFHASLDKSASLLTAGFIVVSALVFIWLGQPPARVLVVVGYLNGLVLPLALAVLLAAVRKRGLLNNYRHPLWLEISGWLVVGVLAWMSVRSVLEIE